MIQYNITHLSVPKIENSTEILDLQKACRLGDLLAIKKAYYANPEKINQKDSNLGWTPLYRTVICGHVKASQFLLKKGADPNLVNNLGEAPLHQAADNSQYELAELLLEFRGDPNLQQNDGDTPLHHAAFRGDKQMVQILLKHSGDPNCPNFMFGRTPLHYASDCKHTECVKLMLEFGGDAYCPDRQGKTPLDLAQSPEIAKLIQNFENSEESQDEMVTFGQKGLDESDLASPKPPLSETVFEPDAEVSEFRRKDLKPIYEWLEAINLHELYEVMVEAGYDDVESMTKQMRSPLPITKEELMKGGVQKPGHCYRIIVKLEEDAGITKKSIVSVKTVEQNKGSFWRCCSVPGSATQGVFGGNCLKEWLKGLKLEELYELFVNSGFDDYDQLITQMQSRYPIDDNILKYDIRINKPGYRNRILSKLQEDTRTLEKRESLMIESSTKNTSCELCLIF